MALSLKDTFIDVRLGEEELEQHVLDVIKARPTGAERRAAISYLRQIVRKDAAKIDYYRYINARAKQLIEERDRLHTFDIRGDKHANLFVQATGVNYNTLLSVANAEVVADGQTIAGDVTVAGNNASLHGIGTGSAVGGTLVCGAIVQGKLTIQADGVVIEGVEFRQTAAQDTALSFVLQGGAPCNSITFRNCRFDGSLYVAGGSKFWNGTNFEGAVVLENCEVKKFTDWMLADLSSEGPAPTTALTSVVVKDCLFTDCKGSFAIRGLQAQPIESVSIVGNKWAYTGDLDASSLHASFWNCFEANNTKDVVVKHNEAAITRLGGNGVRGFFQTWSKADVHYVLQFEKNTLSGFDYAVQIAANSNFYSPDQKDTRLLVKSEPGKITDTRFGLALFYPWDQTVAGAWNPIDVARFPTAVTTDFADALANQA